ncbi:electron transfer flavoprotein subunit alpha/FixB family protein [Halorussus rarus]|uniref:electron transfer flavoprotein subunit alpha/FixB family protein n=1 Tax=Halorussus TaxID=1070314 RepID=UPI000E215707|nr:electron transfer flavoprotein subunit alpha/FixB family protein [Halorussus rarus]NHN58429.1 electron transfer flavoprotein subunit alpha/FixB family protein [Halorussus sp. JP-T4]
MGDDVDLDPSEYTVDELEEKLASVEDPADLDAALAAEQEGDDRKTAREAIQARIDELEAETPGEPADTDHEEEYADEGGTEAPETAGGEGDGESTDDGEVNYEVENHTRDKKHVRALKGGAYEDMWVYCETQQGELLDVSKEMLGKARELMDAYNDEYDGDERVVGVLVGDETVADLTDEVVAYGADVAIYHEDDRLERFRHKPYTEIVADMARGGAEPPNWETGDPGTEPTAEWRDYDKPRYFLFPATNNGRDLSAQVQGELDSGLASDCSGLTIEKELVSNPVKTGEPGEKVEFERVLHMKRPDFSGFEYSTILCLDNPGREFHPQGCSVIPGSFDPIDPDYEREGQVVEHDISLPDDWFRVEVTEFDRLDEGVDLTGHEVVVALGRGIGDDPTEGIELGLDLVEAFDDAALGLSRGVVTASYDVDGHVADYVAEERQIGETGQVVQPTLYIAAGISGAVQHKVGMDESDTIVAINTDTDARIRDFSDYFVEGDLFDVLPRLTESVEAGELTMTAEASDD